MGSRRRQIVQAALEFLGIPPHELFKVASCWRYRTKGVMYHPQAEYQAYQQSHQYPPFVQDYCVSVLENIGRVCTGFDEQGMYAQPLSESLPQE